MAERTVRKIQIIKEQKDTQPYHYSLFQGQDPGPFSPLPSAVGYLYILVFSFYHTFQWFVFVSIN